MTAYFCDQCDGPIRGNVTETSCASCLMGYNSAEDACVMCGDPLDLYGNDEGICFDCQEELDDMGVPDIDDEDW